MARQKPTVVDSTDFAAQLEALVEAAEEGGAHPSDVSAELYARGKSVASEMWD